MLPQERWQPKKWDLPIPYKGALLLKLTLETLQSSAYCFALFTGAAYVFLRQQPNNPIPLELATSLSFLLTFPSIWNEIFRCFCGLTKSNRFARFWPMWNVTFWKKIALTKSNHRGRFCPYMNVTFWFLLPETKLSCQIRPTRDKIGRLL